MPKSQQRRSQPHNPPSSSDRTTLLVVDQMPFLKKALSTCKRLRNELHKKQKLLADFETEDRAAYQQWYHATHGEQLTQLREARDEVAAYEFILHHLSLAARWDYRRVPALYQELMQRKKDGTLQAYEAPQADQGFSDHDDEKDDWDGDEADEGFWGEEDDEEEAARRFFEDMFGDTFQGAEASSASRQKATNPDEDTRLKACYRKLAKRLHPDHSELEETIRERRWHEIQEAYQQGDLETLLRVEAICDMDATGLSTKLGLARLRDLAAYHKSHLIPLRKALSAAKRDIAFGFAEKGASAELKQEVVSELRYEGHLLENEISYMQNIAEEIYEEVEAALQEEAAQRTREQERHESAVRASEQLKADLAAPLRAPRQPKAAEQEEDPAQMSFF